MDVSEAIPAKTSRFTPRRSGSLPVSVIVTACVDGERLRRLLEGLLPSCAACGGELCLVINGAEDSLSPATRAELRRLTDLLLFEPRIGKSHALNRAVAATSGRIVAFTDDDASPASGWLPALLEALEGTSERPVLGVGGPVFPVYPEGGPPPWYRQTLARHASHFLGPKHFLGHRRMEYPLSVGHEIGGLPMGANCAYRREALERFPYCTDLGPNRETGLRGGEDTLLALRVQEAGGALIYEPTARVYHPVDPERMTLRYAEEGHRINARELSAILRILGRKQPSRRGLERLIRRRTPGLLERAYSTRDRLVRRSLHRLYCEMLLSAGAQP